MIPRPITVVPLQPLLCDNCAASPRVTPALTSLLSTAAPMSVPLRSVATARAAPAVADPLSWSSISNRRTCRQAVHPPIYRCLMAQIICYFFWDPSKYYPLNDRWISEILMPKSAYLLLPILVFTVPRVVPQELAGSVCQQEFSREFLSLTSTFLLSYITPFSLRLTFKVGCPFDRIIMVRIQSVHQPRVHLALRFSLPICILLRFFDFFFIYIMILIIFLLCSGHTASIQWPSSS